MAKLTFTEYCEDFLDVQVCLMSEKERSEAFEGYNTLFVKNERKEAHKDAGLKLPELKAKVSRLVSNQKIAIERNTDKDVSKARAFVSAAENLKGRITKDMLLNLITMSSGASREINRQS